MSLPEHQTIAGALQQTRRGQAVVAEALELLPELGQFAVQSAEGEASFAPERFAASVRRACQSAGVTDEAVAAEAACVALVLLREHALAQERPAAVTPALLCWAASEALLSLGIPAAAVAAALGEQGSSVGVSAAAPRRGEGLALLPLPLAATGKGDARLLERAMAFAERTAGLGAAASTFRDDKSRAAFIDAAAKLGAAGAWDWRVEAGGGDRAVSFAPLSTVPNADGQPGGLGTAPAYPVPVCSLRLAAFLAEDGLRAEALLATVEVALVAADAQVEEAVKAFPLVRGAAAGLRHVRVELDAAKVALPPAVVAALGALVQGQLVVGSARLALSLGAYRAWALNHKPAVRMVGRERDRASAVAAEAPVELGDRVRQVWNQALELAMAHGLRNAGLYVAPRVAATAVAPLEPKVHRFAVRGVPGAIWVTYGANARPASVTIRCGEPRSAAGIILATASTGISAALARGASLADAVAPYVGTAFPPRGLTDDPAHPQALSPLDYAARWLASASADSTERVSAGV
jgi:hypothetical protein